MNHLARLQGTPRCRKRHVRRATSPFIPHGTAEIPRTPLSAQMSRRYLPDRRSRPGGEGLRRGTSPRPQSMRSGASRRMRRRRTKGRNRILEADGVQRRAMNVRNDRIGRRCQRTKAQRLNRWHRRRHQRLRHYQWPPKVHDACHAAQHRRLVPPETEHGRRRTSRPESRRNRCLASRWSRRMVETCLQHRSRQQEREISLQWNHSSASFRIHYRTKDVNFPPTPPPMLRRQTPRSSPPSDGTSSPGSRPINSSNGTSLSLNATPPRPSRS
jgi:hypothetical protein